MAEILQLAQGAGDLLKWIAAVGGSLIVIWKWVAKPLREVKLEVTTFEKNVTVQVDKIKSGTVEKVEELTDEVKSQMMDMCENVGNVQGTVDFLLGDRLAQAHAYWMHKGYCPPADKARLVTMHKVYAGRGLNHLYASFEEDLIGLPDYPPNEKER